MERRPIASRETGWAKASARFCAKFISPNQISMLSMPVALLGGLGLVLMRNHPILGVILSIVGVQGRLLCNLFDGMVALEYGKKTKSGAFWNEFPDRVGDTCIILGFGYCVGMEYGSALIALLAMATAYIRLLGVTAGTKTYFSGPMAKQQRMAWITLWVVLYLPLYYIFPAQLQLVGAVFFWVLIIGTLLTCMTRIRAILKELC